MKSSCLALAFAWMLSSFAGVNSASAQSRLQPIKGSSVSVSPSKANVPVRREVKKLVVSIASPNGFEYAGVDENEQSMGDYGFAPAKAFLTAKVKSNSETAQYAWKYKTVTMGSNMEDKTSASQSISFKMPEGLYPSPEVTATDGSLKTVAKLAADGIYYGKGYMGNHDCVNYRPAQCSGYYTDPTVLLLNSAEANSGLDYIWSAAGINHFELLGFAEAFAYSKPYYLEGVTAEITCSTTPTEADLEAHVYARKLSGGGYSVDLEDLMDLHVAKIIPSSVSDRYRVVFEPDSAVRVGSAIMVVVTTPKSSNCQIGMVFPEEKLFNSDNTGVCNLYANFMIGNSKVERQFLDFSGVEMADDNGKTTGYLNNFMIGLRKSYTKPSTGIGEVQAAKQATGKVYNLSGQCVGEGQSAASLPHGIYVIDGRKVVK